mmetsp:Transcript_7221/g.15815  ORF Transcript_7221/g.15815 Transcript_7221/m.15815 type:complete len:210 (-) Transcript_7221:945-1574(-)
MSDKGPCLLEHLRRLGVPIRWGHARDVGTGNPEKRRPQHSERAQVPHTENQMIVYLHDAVPVKNRWRPTLILDEVSLVLEVSGELAHRRVPNHDVDCLLESPEDRVLHIRHAVLLAERLDERLRLLVRERREVRPHVVLNLVVEPAMHEIVEVRACPEVGTRDDGTQVEGRRARRAMLLEAVQVRSRMVGDDVQEGVRVGEELGEDERD